MGATSRELRATSYEPRATSKRVLAARSSKLVAFSSRRLTLSSIRLHCAVQAFFEIHFGFIPERLGRKTDVCQRVLDVALPFGGVPHSSRVAGHFLQELKRL